MDTESSECLSLRHVQTSKERRNKARHSVSQSLMSLNLTGCLIKLHLTTRCVYVFFVVDLMSLDQCMLDVRIYSIFVRICT